MITVVALLIFTLGWREGLIVALAVPISFSLALFVNYLFGYTINRVTLFALILTLGLVVDDPITNVDNIQRHILSRRRNPFLSTLWGYLGLVVVQHVAELERDERGDLFALPRGVGLSESVSALGVSEQRAARSARRHKSRSTKSVGTVVAKVGFT